MNGPWVDAGVWDAIPRPLDMKDGDLLIISFDPGNPAEKVRGIIASVRTDAEGTTSMSFIADPFDA